MNRQEVVRLYTEQHWKMQRIGDAAGVSRQAIQRMLQRAGIDRTQGTHVAGRCDYAPCGKDIVRIRAIMLNGRPHYCSKGCYYKSRRKKG